MKQKFFLFFTFGLLLQFEAHATEMLKDNSFLIEEAYNQEPGVVQFIQTYQYFKPEDRWDYAFTNEIPIGDETHQFAYSIPVSKIKSGTTEENLVGDVGLNYRYQLYHSDVMTMTPSLTLTLPTGDYKKGSGNGAVGLKYNHSLSLALNETWVNHWNAGFSFVPNAKDSSDNKASVFGYNFGTSFIYNVTPKTNIMFEFSANTNEEVTGPESKSASSTYYFAPGFRTAFQAGEETEIVPGIAALLGLGDSASRHETGIFAYLSIESKLW